MGLFDKIRAEFVDIVEWIDDSQHTLAWRFPRYHNQIKNGAQLIVRPGQLAVFVNQGKIADVFEPGQYTLNTANLPLLSTLQGWKFGFDSPFKAEVYFISTKQITDLKWGTPNPIMLRDADFGPIRLRAFGIYTLKALDPKAILTELVGTDGSFDAEEVGELIRATIAQCFTDLLAESKIAALDLASNYNDMGDALRKKVCEAMDTEYGLQIPTLRIVNISFPPEVEKALDTRTKMNLIGNLGQYQQFQTAEAMVLAAGNPAGGGMGQGMGMGMGFAMANQLAGAGAAPSMAPPPPPAQMFHISVGGQTQGPFQVTQIVSSIGAGQVTGQTLVWAPGQAGWLPANAVPALAGYFAAPPPPPPPSTP